MINFTQAFDSAWERMMIILFRPFSFGKWCAIGFCAFLAGLLQGGNGFNSSFNTNNLNKDAFNGTGRTPLPQFDIHQFNSGVNSAISGMQTGMIVIFAVLITLFVLAIILLMYWLGARGQFMFLDNVVRNRGAIAWPWSRYAQQGNSLFLFHLLLLAVVLVVIVILVGLAAIFAIPLFVHKQWPGGPEIAFFVVLGIAYLAFCFAFGIVLFLFREFGVPIMFRNGLMARAAFMETFRLVQRFPGTIALFVLLRIAIFIGVVILSLVICCVTIPCCCLGQWPYIGTVILLPVLVYVKCFTLDCLAQLGPEYNVWTVDVPAPSTPLPPLG